MPEALVLCSAALLAGALNAVAVFPGHLSGALGFRRELAAIERGRLCGCSGWAWRAAWAGRSSSWFPSDNPLVDCAPHAERVAALLQGLSFAVERHPVPQDLVRANGMVSATNLVVRHRFGEGGPVVALNAHGDVVPLGEGWTRDP